MDGESGNTASLRPGGLATPLTRLLGTVVLTVAALMFLLGTVLLARRLAGALVRPLDTAPLLATSLLLAAIAAGLRLAWGRLPAARASVGRSWLVWSLPALALLAFAFALSLPDTLAWPLAAFWAILAIEEGASLWTVWRNLDVREPDADVTDDAAGGLAAGGPEARAGDVAGRPAAAATTEDSLVDRELTDAVSDLISDLEGGEPGSPEWVAVGKREVRVDPPQQPAPHLLPPTASQQLTRSLADDGSDVLYGLLRGHFAPGQRSLRLHVSFCPPFDTVPAVTVERVEGPDVTVKPAQILAYGLRLDLRLKTLSAESQDVVLELFVRETN